MMTFEAARAAILKSPVRQSSLTIETSQAIGSVLSENIRAPFDMPRFDNSAVDGFAVSASDRQRQQSVRIIGRAAAGETTGLCVDSGHAVQVFTGSRVPPGTAAIVMQEDVKRTGECLTLEADVELGANIRTAGREIQAGTVVFEAGTFVTPPVISALSSLGLRKVAVVQRPKIGLLVTGSELAEAGEVLGESQIYESNSVALMAVFNQFGYEVTKRRVLDDSSHTLVGMSDLLERCDVLITVGGVSVGELDFVRSNLTKLKFETIVPRLSIKPGKPFTFARRKDDKVAFGLPGNPMSALVTFSLFVWPYLRQVSGNQVQEEREARFSGEHTNNGDRTEFLPGIETVEGSVRRVSCVPPIGSHSVSGLCQCDCLVQIPPFLTVSEGDVVLTHALPWSNA